MVGCLAGPRPRTKGRVEWACVRAPTGVCACVGVYMRVGALSGFCAHVCGCQRCGGRGTPGWLGWSEQSVRELAPSMDLHSGVESWVCVPESSFAQVCSRCGCHCVCDTEDERRMPEAWVCVSQGILHPNVGPWPLVWIKCLSLHGCVRSRTGIAGGVLQALPSPCGNGASFWAPYPVCPTRPACVCARSSTVQYGSLGQEPWLGRKMSCGRAEPGPPGPSRRRCLGSPRFPGSGFPLTPPGHSGLPPPQPHPRPRNVPFRSSLPPQGQAPGGRHSSASLPGSLGGSKAGRTPGFLPPSHPREKFLRGPLRLWVPKITLRGKGGCGEKGAGGAQSLAAGCCRCLWKEGARRRGTRRG